LSAYCVRRAVSPSRTCTLRTCLHVLSEQVQIRSTRPAVRTGSTSREERLAAEVLRLEAVLRNRSEETDRRNRILEEEIERLHEAMPHYLLHGPEINDVRCCEREMAWQVAKLHTALAEERALRDKLEMELQELKADMEGCYGERDAYRMHAVAMHETLTEEQHLRTVLENDLAEIQAGMAQAPFVE
jgi:uncharacterized coiled-coil DUF342 family protein